MCPPQNIALHTLYASSHYVNTMPFLLRSGSLHVKRLYVSCFFYLPLFLHRPSGLNPDPDPFGTPDIESDHLLEQHLPIFTPVMIINNEIVNLGLRGQISSRFSCLFSRGGGVEWGYATFSRNHTPNRNHIHVWHLSHSAKPVSQAQASS